MDGWIGKCWVNCDLLSWWVYSRVWLGELEK